MRFSTMRTKTLGLLIAATLHAQSGNFKIHMILHEIGEEHYEIATDPAGALTLNSTFEYSDRGTKRSTTAVLKMRGDYTPLALDLKTAASGAVPGAGRSVVITNSTASVQEDQNQHSIGVPAKYFTIYGPSPFAVQMAMMRYWIAHGKPAELPVLRANSGQHRPDPIRIEFAGRDSVTLSGKPVTLDCYTVANLMFGREVLWTTLDGQLVAAMTFAGGLPMEAVRSDYQPAFPQLYSSGVLQEMGDLTTLGKQAPAERLGDFAIVGATLVDGTGAPPVPDSAVVVRNGRIFAAGPRGKVAIPPGVTPIKAPGKTLLPGLW